MNERKNECRESSVEDRCLISRTTASKNITTTYMYFTVYQTLLLALCM